jgi:hypothetical protein
MTMRLTRWQLCKQFAPIYAALACLVICCAGALTVIVQNILLAYQFHDTEAGGWLYALGGLCILCILAGSIVSTCIARYQCEYKTLNEVFSSLCAADAEEKDDNTDTVSTAEHEREETSSA